MKVIKGDTRSLYGVPSKGLSGFMSGLYRGCLGIM